MVADREAVISLIVKKTSNVANGLIGIFFLGIVDHYGYGIALDIGFPDWLFLCFENENSKQIWLWIIQEFLNKFLLNFCQILHL